MPELPEVKTIVTDLKSIILNKEITKVVSITSKSLEFEKEYSDLNLLKNQQIKDIYQFGKNIIFLLSNCKIVIHLRMEGKLIYKEKEEDKIIKFPIFEFHFNDGSKLFLTDHRKFATVKIFNSDKNDKEIFINNGPEPWDVDVNILFNKSKKSRTPIKVFLLNQKNMSGLGNIYVDEVLYASKIHPEQKTNTLNFDEIELILKNSILILKEAIKYRGSSISTYNSLGEKGSYQERLRVHTKENSKCSCGATIVKIKVGGRGTYFCPKEQK